MISRIQTFFSYHAMAFIAAVTLTLFIQAPLFLFPVLQGSQYQGINIAHFGTDEHYYLLRASAVLKGTSPGDPVLEDDTQGVDHTFSYVEKILFAPLAAVGMSESSTVFAMNVYNTIGIFFLILLIYAFVLRLAGSRRAAIAAALFAIGGYSIVYHKSLFYDDFNIYSRMVFPLVSSLFFFGFLNLLVRCLKTGKRVDALYAGIVFGAFFYIYYFLWSFSLAATGCLLLWFLLKKKKAEALQILVVLSVAVVAGAYNVVAILRHFGSASGAESSYVSWALHTHAPVFSLVSVAAAAAVGLCIWKTKSTDGLFVAFSLALLAGGVVALNEQVVTGLEIQYGHYYWYFIVPVSIITGVVAVWFLLSKEIHRTVFAGLLVAVALLNTGVGQYRSYATTLAEKQYDQYLKPALDILSQDASSAVVFAPDDVDSSLVPIYTHHYLFWYDQALEGGVSVDRLKEALFMYVYVAKYGRHDFSGFITNELEKKGDGSMYGHLFETLEGLKSGLDYYVYIARVKAHDPDLLLKRAVLIKSLDAEYRLFFKDPEAVLRVLQERHVGYVLWDSNQNPEWDLSFIKSLTPVNDSHGIRLFRIF